MTFLYLEPVLCFWAKQPSKRRPKLQSKQGSFGFQVWIEYVQFANLIQFESITNRLLERSYFRDGEVFLEFNIKNETYLEITKDRHSSARIFCTPQFQLMVWLVGLGPGGLDS